MSEGAGRMAEVKNGRHTGGGVPSVFAMGGQRMSVT